MWPRVSWAVHVATGNLKTGSTLPCVGTATDRPKSTSSADLGPGREWSARVPSDVASGHDPVTSVPVVGGRQGAAGTGKAGRRVLASRPCVDSGPDVWSVWSASDGANGEGVALAPAAEAGTSKGRPGLGESKCRVTNSRPPDHSAVSGGRRLPTLASSLEAVDDKGGLLLERHGPVV